MLITEDAKSFFPSISMDKVKRLFQYFFKFSPEVSEVLSKLCTKDGFLVQGSPVSGDIANLIFYRNEPSLVEWCISKKLRYTRYYDDIHVSSETETFYEHLEELKCKIYQMFGIAGVKPHRGNNKSRILRDSARISVHDVTVNSMKATPSSDRISKCRLELFHYRKAVENRDNIDEIIKSYRSIKGQIGTLNQQGYNKYKKFLVELQELTSKINDVDAKKYIRKYRKIKSVELLRKFGGKVSVLKQISPQVKAIIEAERKSAYLKNSK